MKGKDAIIGFIIGDILGVPAEFFKREYLEKNPVTDMIENKTRRSRVGFWSDDTAMTLCTMQSIIDNKGINYVDLLDKFLKWLETGYMAIDNKCFGIGQSTLRALLYHKRNRLDEKLITLNGFKASINHPRNAGNGSLMRILPVTLYLYDKDIPIHQKRRIIEQASDLTHGDKDCSAACAFYSFFIFNLLDTNHLTKSMEMSIKQFEENFDINGYGMLHRILLNKITKVGKDEVKSSGYVIDTLEASLWCLFNTNSYEEAVLTAVNLGGDTDTIAAITGSMAGIYYGLETIPKKWIDNICDKEKIDRILNDYIEILR